MSLESVTYIGDLNVSNPDGSDGMNDVDNHIRNVKTAVRNCFPGFTGPIMVGGTTGGSVNAYTLSPATAVPALVEGMMVVCEFHTANTSTTPTLNISGLGAKTIVACDGNAVVSGDLLGSRYTALLYDGTNFQLLAVTKNYCDQLAFNTVLPAQTGNARKFLKTDGTAASWGYAGFNGVITLTGASEVVESNKEQILCMDGTFSLSFTAASALGTAFGCILDVANSTSVITLDPHSGELIDGLTAFKMYGNESRFVAVNSAGGLKTIVIEPFAAVFTASTSILIPPGYEGGLDVTLWPGGAGGDGGNTASAGLGGGGGAYAHGIVGDYTAGVSVTLNIGAGGSGGTGVSAGAQVAGGPGGDSSFGSALIALGAPSGGRGAGFFPTAAGSLSTALWMYQPESGLSSGKSFWGGANGGITAGDAGGRSKHGGTGGGAGVNASSAPGAGGQNYAGAPGGTATAGQSGGAGTTMPPFSDLGGTGGAGGSRIGPQGGDGGPGGEPAGGGGGGSTPTPGSGAKAGSGGAGAPGKAIIRGVK